MQLDRIEGKPDEKVAWGSDIAAQMLRRLGIPYISLNPGASYRGLHDSLVNHLGNERPGILLCLHEDHSVAIAHGYAKATGEPMACVLHSNVGLLHGMMSLFNAWCDRVPMIVLGATGPVDAEKRRPWIDWIHTSRDQGAFIRSIIKWDDQPIVAAGAGGIHVPRQYRDAHGADRAGLYLPRRRLPGAAARQGAGMAGHRALRAAEPSRPAKSAVDEAVALLARAERPLIMFGRGSRKPECWQPRIRLAERLGACVVTDLKQGAMFPTDHPAHYLPPFNVLPKPARELLCEADVILALDWVDLGGALRQARAVGKVSAKIIAAHARPEPAHRRQHGISGAAAVRRVDGDDRRCRRRRLAGGVGVGPPARSRGRRARRQSPGRPTGRASPWSRSPRRCAPNSTIRRTSPSARSAAAGRSTSGRSRTAWPISARTAAAGSAPGPVSRSARRSRCRASAATPSRCSATAISAWARPRSGPRCAIASRCSS